MNKEERKELGASLAQHTTLVLSTLGERGCPSAAALFYAEDRDLNLYFISEATCEHSRNIESTPQVAIVVAGDGQDWKELTGIQMKGMCSLLRGNARTRARKRYLAKFPFIVRNATLRKRIRQSEFYVIRPEWIRLTDNRRGFSDKREWILNR